MSLAVDSQAFVTAVLEGDGILGASMPSRGLWGIPEEELLRAPTLMLTAESSRIRSLESVLEMQQLIPHCEVVVFHGVSGFVQFGEPEKCAEALLTFLRRP